MSRQSLSICLCLHLAAPFVHGQMVTGSGMLDYAETLGLREGKPAFTASYLGSSAPSSILWPGEAAVVTAQVVNVSSAPLRVGGRIDLIRYGTRGIPNDIWRPQMVRIAQVASIPVAIDLEPDGWTNLVFSPAIPETKGAYALVVDFDSAGRVFLASLVRTFAQSNRQPQYPVFCMDIANAETLTRLGVDYVDESEVLTPADYAHHIDKWAFTVPFVCGATNLGEALRRITEGAAMIRSKGEAGTGDVSNATTHMRTLRDEIRRLTSLPEDELYLAAKDLQAPYELVKEIATTGKLPVVLFTAGGIATPADAAMMMQLGAEGVFVGSGIFKSGNPAERAAAIVKATTFFDDPDVIANVSRGLGEAMVGINVDDVPVPHRLAERGW